MVVRNDADGMSDGFAQALPFGSPEGQGCGAHGGGQDRNTPPPSEPLGRRKPRDTADGEPRTRPVFPLPDKELFGYTGRAWLAAPDEYIVPAILPWAVPLGRSERTVVALRGIDVWPEAMTLRISVYALDNLVEDGRAALVDHTGAPDRHALLIGVLFADGSRASSDTVSMPSATRPDQPVLRADDGGGDSFHVRHDVFVWPLPPPGPMNLVVQWLDRGIEETFTELDGMAIRDAAARAREIWPGLHRRPPEILPGRAIPPRADASDGWTAFGPENQS